MAHQLTAQDARQSLSAHVAEKGAELFAKYGPHVGWRELQLILKDQSCARYPCEIVFDSTPLEPGELALPLPIGDRPEAGFRIHVAPLLMMQLEQLTGLVLYQLVVVNYGPFATSDDAEIFGATALGLPREQYYQSLCALADQLAGALPPAD